MRFLSVVKEGCKAWNISFNLRNNGLLRLFFINGKEGLFYKGWLMAFKDVWER